MRPELEIFERIEDYLEGRLSAAEKAEFENLIENDADFAQEVEDRKNANEALLFAGLHQLRESISVGVTNVPYHKPVSKLWWLLSLLLLPGIYFLIPSTINSDKQDNQIFLTDTNDVIEEIDSTIFEKSLLDSVPPKEAHPQEEIKDTEVIVNDKYKGDVIVTDNVSKDIEKNHQSIDHVELKSKELPKGHDFVPVVKKELPCDGNFTVTESRACRGTATGSIQIKTNQSEVFDLKLNNQTYSFGQLPIEELETGKYSISISYLKNCVFTKDVVILEKWCPKNLAYSFNPEMGDQWEILLDDGDQGDLQILNQSGSIVFSSNFDWENPVWEGKNMNEEFVAPGLYIALLKYSDGRNEKVELTIIR